MNCYYTLYTQMSAPLDKIKEYSEKSMEEYPFCFILGRSIKRNWELVQTILEYEKINAPIYFISKETDEIKNLLPDENQILNTWTQVKQLLDDGEVPERTVVYWQTLSKEFGGGWIMDELKKNHKEYNINFFRIALGDIDKDPISIF